MGSTLLRRQDAAGLDRVGDESQDHEGQSQGQTQRAEPLEGRALRNDGVPQTDHKDDEPDRDEHVHQDPRQDVPAGRRLVERGEIERDHRRGQEEDPDPRQAGELPRARLAHEHRDDNRHRLGFRIHNLLSFASRRRAERSFRTGFGGDGPSHSFAASHAQGRPSTMSSALNQVGVIPHVAVRRLDAAVGERDHPRRVEPPRRPEPPPNARAE